MPQLSEAFVSLKLIGESALTQGLARAKQQAQNAFANLTIKPQLGLNAVKNLTQSSFVSGIMQAKGKIQDAAKKLVMSFAKPKVNTENMSVRERFLMKQKEEFDKAYESMGNSIKRAGERARNFALTLTGLAAGTVAVGDWKVWQDFKVALEVLARTVGVMLAPLIKELTGYIITFSQWLGGLSESTQGVIRIGVKFGVVFGMIGWALSKLFFIVPPVVSLLKGLASALGGLLGPLTSLLAKLATGVGVAAGATAIAIGAILYTAKKVNDDLNKIIPDAERMRKGDIRKDDIKFTTGTWDVYKKVGGAKSKEEALQIADAEAKKAKEKYLSMYESYGNRANMGKGFSQVGGYFGFNTQAKQMENAYKQFAMAEGLATRLREGKSIGKDMTKPKKEMSLSEQMKENFMTQHMKPTQMMGIMDAWKNAMQNNVETPEQRYLKQMLDLMNKQIEATKDNKPPEPVGSV